jgi:hypothetical protein
MAESAVEQVKYIPRETAGRSDSHEIARQVERAKGRGVVTGLALLWRMRFEAWLEEHVARLVVRKLVARAQVAHTHADAMRAEHALHAEVRDGEIQSLKRTIDVVPARPAVSEPARPPVSVHISDDHIRSMALRAVMTAGTGEGARERLEAYLAELRKQLPPNVAQEVEASVRETLQALR